MNSAMLALKSALTSPVLLPDDPGYESARHIWNADIDRHPAAIVQCGSAQEVSDAVRWCVDAGFPLTVRSGGHNLAGTSVVDGAVMIDTRRMTGVRFDEERDQVIVGAGCTWGDVDRPAAELNVAVPAGVVSHTGVAGLALGGGTGYLARQFGATVDHIVEIEVVVADGRILRVNKDSHPDLFWALKGAGHNFGVATEFVFSHVPLPGLATVRQALYGADDRLSILRFFREWAVDAPRHIGTYIRLYRCPPYWSQVPAEHRGRPIISVATVSYGDPSAATETAQPMFEQGTPIYESIRTIPHVTLQHATDDEFRHGIRHYWRNMHLTELPDELLETAIEWSDRYPGRSLNASASIAHQVMCPFEVIAGSPTPRDSSNDSTTGVGGRYSANIGADWEYADEREPLVQWVKDFDEAMTPFRRGTYINFASTQGDRADARAVYGAKYDRLVDVKREYDPLNVFDRGLVDLSETTVGESLDAVEG